VATDVEYGPVDASTFSIDPPADARVVNVSPGRGHHRNDRRALRKLPFQVSAPDTLAGRQRSGVKRLGKAAVIRYGKDLDAILVIEKRAKAEKPQSGDRHHELDFPTVDINGSTARVIDTPLGSVVTFERGGVSYTVLGSVHAAETESAARGL
jgi:hypothetical protein